MTLRNPRGAAVKVSIRKLYDSNKKSQEKPRNAKETQKRSRPKLGAYQGIKTHKISPQEWAGENSKMAMTSRKIIPRGVVSERFMRSGSTNNLVEQPNTEVGEGNAERGLCYGAKHKEN